MTDFQKEIADTSDDETKADDISEATADNIVNESKTESDSVCESVPNSDSANSEIASEKIDSMTSEQTLSKENDNETTAQWSPVSLTEQNKAEIKKIHKTYRVILVIVAVLVVAGIIILNFAFKNAVSLQKAEYEASKAAYDKAYNEIITAQEDWKKELSDKQEALNKAYEELEAIYAERQAEIDAEEARWNALTKEEQDAETSCNSYNEMVSYLRANNTDYAEIYVDYAKYLDKNIFELGKEEALAYTELYEKKIRIEKQYMIDKGLLDADGNGSAIPLQEK